ncbi:hypothetical protein B0F90DRAFT_1634028 [Multifurca ochricompacta]|uniref:Wax synthase domain-containing protein n=1 Tax=Multifurca ochricompacta TaxID=376703 RepID=A0AAD4M2W8_9AGAM|nr:hypothetical protein B0F90DRAFT_1634028 [Multifurca ochricompacta]
MFPDIPDPALRQPLTISAIAPLYLSFYALGVLAILSNTFLLKLSLLPFIVWQAWKCAVGLDLALGLARLFGLESADGLALWNLSYVMSIFFMTLRSFEWTFTERPLRKYELLNDHDKTPVERPLSISNVLLDGIDLLFNQRGIGWSWSANPFPGRNAPPLSIGSILARLLIKITMFDAALYLLQLACPSVNQPRGGTLFDPSLTFWPRIAAAGFAATCGGAWSYASVDSMYHLATLIGRIILRQPASQWPPISRRPWMATSIQEFWGFRWHQFFRHFFITFGARPGGALLGQPGALIGAFTISAVIHHVGLWGVGQGTEFSSGGGFFVFMGLGAAMEAAFKKLTGLHVGGFIGKLWTIFWIMLWGAFMLDGWARRGLLSSPENFRPGKSLVDAVIAPWRQIVVSYYQSR